LEHDAFIESHLAKGNAMIATLISLLFAAALCLALGVIMASWLSYGPQVLALRQQLAQCDVQRDVRFTVITTLVRSNSGDTWKPGFSPLAGAPQRPRRPLPRHFLRAA
jgi:uncharacterized membrane protein YciS (DUF1049 family)